MAGRARGSRAINRREQRLLGVIRATVAAGDSRLCSGRFW
jgi:hypothetical protein